MKIQISKKHVKIEQLDGVNDAVNDQDEMSMRVRSIFGRVDGLVELTKATWTP